MCIFVSVYECVPVGIGGMAFGPDVNTSPGHRSRPFVHDVCPIPASLTITSDRSSQNVNCGHRAYLEKHGA